MALQRSGFKVGPQKFKTWFCFFQPGSFTGCDRKILNLNTLKRLTEALFKSASAQLLLKKTWRVKWYRFEHFELLESRHSSVGSKHLSCKAANCWPWHQSLCCIISMGSSTGGDIANSQKAWKSPTKAEAWAASTHAFWRCQCLWHVLVHLWIVPYLGVRVKNCNSLWISYEFINRMMIDQCTIMYYQCVIHQKNQDAP